MTRTPSDDQPAFRGGLYEDLHRLDHSPDLHCHHIVPQAALREAGMEPNRSPAVQMQSRDHRDTRSYGGRANAKRYRQRILELLSSGGYDEAVQLGADEVRQKWPGKYDAAIGEALAADREEQARKVGPVGRPDAATTRAAPMTEGQANVTLLVNRLAHYLETLDRHNAAIQQAYDHACESLANLQRVWGGEAAQDFYTRFGSTTEAMERYLEGSRRVREVLEQRLSTLRQADRPVGS